LFPERYGAAKTLVSAPLTTPLSGPVMCTLMLDPPVPHAIWDPLPSRRSLKLNKLEPVAAPPIDGEGTILLANSPVARPRASEEVRSSFFMVDSLRFCRERLLSAV